MDDIKFQVPNDINVVIQTKEKGVLLDENCCTCINIMLTNNGKIATSFLGTHNPFIVNQLEKAQREYFKVLKKTLKKDYKEYADYPDFDDCECDCEHEHCECGCEEGKHEHCGCGCEDEHTSCEHKEGKKKDCKDDKNEHKNCKCKK